MEATAGRGAVFVVDDHRVFADALALGLSSQADLRCAGVAYSLAQARAALRVEELRVDGLRADGVRVDGLRADGMRVDGMRVDLAVVDLDLADGSGLRLVEDLEGRMPVLVLTAHHRVDLARRAAAAGAAGFLPKDATLAEILAAVRAALAGRSVRAPEPTAPVHVTARELEVLAGLGRGHDAASLAAELGISVHTTRDHIATLLGKLGVHSQLDAVVTADRLGLIAVGARI